MKNRMIMLCLLLFLCLDVYSFKVNSPIILKKFCFWKPICCAKMVSSQHPDTLIRCADIDYLGWACAPSEDVCKIAEKIDTGFVFHVQDSVYEKEMRYAIHYDPIIDSIFLHESIEAIVNRFFAFYQDNWYLSVLCNRNGETIIATKNPRTNDLHPGDNYVSTNIDYLLYRLQQEHLFCCIDDLLNVILIHQEDYYKRNNHVDVR